MIIAKIYTNDGKLFDTKIFKVFGHFEFWINRREKIFKIRKEKNLIFVKKILVYQKCEYFDGLLTTWIYDFDKSLSMTDLTEEEILKYDKEFYEFKYDKR